MTAVDILEQLKTYFYPGTLVFIDDTKNNGLDDVFTTDGFTKDMNRSRADRLMWYFRREAQTLSSIRYHPITEEMPYHHKVTVEEGLKTRVDFLAGEAPLIYRTCRSMLDAGFRVGIPPMRERLQELSLFRKKGHLYVKEKVITL